ncbi:tripartite tricarboxylate transporter TctB family protein [Devosia elaeis]|uniref:DUF1468 domain-containing protein n=1 Tax=Devosia elaeis TaxID=1770058 RepID=A0A178HLX8_9HYPH|nr:tripartite tricarboxylate transporter TctB family protein [Devosia elaeis]OAM72986.1 hypothetical protein A3840_18865 [Devosia elaeis]
MKRAVNLVILLFCTLYLMLALALPMGTPARPGIGFMPILLGVGGVVLAGWSLGNSMLEAPEGTHFSGWHAVAPPLVYLTLLALYVPAMSLVGFMFSSMAVLTGLLLTAGLRNPLAVGGLAIGFSVVLQFVFATLLGVPLP